MQLMEVRRVSRRRRGWRWVLFLVLAGLTAGAWLAYEPAKVRYRAWKRGHALEQARESIARHDVAKTQLALEVALNAGPANPDTIRVAADMLEQVGAPQAMRLRRAVTRMLPQSASDHAAVVMACLRFRDFNAARDALRSIPPKVAAEPPALHAALAYALATGDNAVADVILGQLRQHEPSNDGLAFTHALLRTKLPRPDDRAAAVADVERIVGRNPQLRLTADRQLAGAAMLHRDYAAARQYLQRVLASAEAGLSDRLQLANLDLLVDQQPFAEVFGRLAPAAGSTPADATRFVQWLLVQNRVAEAAAWLETLAPATRSAPAVAQAEADLAARRRDWGALEKLLQGGAWGPVPAETIRLAGAAIAVDTPDKPALRKEVWELALGRGGTSLGTLTALLQIASGWGWNAEAELTLWSIGRRFPDQTWVFQHLFNAYKLRQDTQGMRTVLGHLRDSDPSLPRYRHDWALLTVLAEPGQNWDTAKATLAELYQANQDDATFATGYAVALAQAGRGPEALAVVGQMTAEERSFPPRQPYLAYVYGIAGQPLEFERAKAAMAGYDFLPEEKLLVQRGQEALHRPLPKPPPPAGPKA